MIASEANAVKALGSASDQIVIVWDPVVDNVGVVGYQVYRDGTLIATTPYPVFTDTGLQTSTSYSYSIIAVDAAGNLSEPSIAVLGLTLGASDVQAPPAPTLLSQMEVAVGRIDLFWVQSDIGDVVSFRVYRGNAPDAVLDPLVNVTSTQMTDATVSSGVDYCYQVAAVDASGNESEPRSEVLCVQTPNGAIGAPSVATSQVPPLAGLTLPDVETINCDLQFTQSVISENTTLSEPCYTITQDVLVDSFANLTVAAGTVLKFAQDTKLVIEGNASFTANGTAQAPVVLTGVQAVPGFWGGVLFNRSNSPKNLFSHTVVEYAGGLDVNAGIAVLSSIGDQSRLRIENCLIRFNDGAGLAFAGLGLNMDSFKGNLVTKNQEPLVLNMLSLPQFKGPNDLTGNADDIISVARLTVSNDLLIPNLQLPYEFIGLGVDLNARLIIEAGVEMRFYNGTGIEVQGSIQAKGTVSQPIKLTARVPASGEWEGVAISDNDLSSMENVVIEFAGQPREENTAGAGLHLTDAKIALANVVLRDNANFGIYASGQKSAFTRFDKVSVIRNDQTGSLPINSLHTLSASAEMQGNERDRIDVTGTDLSGVNGIWHDLGVAYRFSGSHQITEGSVTISPGVNIIADNQAQIIVARSAYLNATGTPDKVIKLSATNPAVDVWGGLVYRSDNPMNILEQVVLENAGSVTTNNPDIQQSGAIRLECTANFPASVSISNADISASASWGLYADPLGCTFNRGLGVRFIDSTIGETNIP